MIDKDEGSSDDAKEADICNVVSSPQFREAQEENRELQTIWAHTLHIRNDQMGTLAGTSHYEVRNQLLYWVQSGRTVGQEETQLVLPTWFHHLIWRLAHANPTGGHLD